MRVQDEGVNAMTEAASLPLFKTAKGALLFAYNFSHGTVKKPFLASLMGGSRPAGKGLGGLDGAAQAGMIKAEVAGMSQVHRFIIAARYSPPKTPCECRAPCCVGFRLNRDWAEAIDWLAMHVHAAALTGTVSNYRLRRALVMRWFGQEVSMTEVASNCRVKRDTAAEHNKRVVAYLGVEETGAEREIYGRLYAAGVIES